MSASIRYYRSLLIALLTFPIVSSKEVFLGEFREILHQVGGKAYALSEKVIEIREFRYDGQGPAVYFWLDTDSNPSTSGFGLTSPQNVPSCGMKIGYAADGNQTARIELPDNTKLSCKSQTDHYL